MSLNAILVIHMKFWVTNLKCQIFSGETRNCKYVVCIYNYLITQSIEANKKTSALFL